MKKLLSVLGVIGIVASTSTSVVACGGNSKDNSGMSPLEQEAITATTSMSKILLQGKSENMGVNVTDPLASYNPSLGSINTSNPSYWERYKGATESSYDEFGKEKADVFSSWEDMFSDLTLNSKTVDGQKAPTMSITDVIDNNQIAKTTIGEDGKVVTGNEGLSYLLSDSTRSRISGSADTSGMPTADQNFYMPTNYGDLSKKSDTTIGNLAARTELEVSEQDTSIVLNPKAKSIGAFSKFLNNLIGFTTNAWGVAQDSDDWSEDVWMAGGKLSEFILGTDGSDSDEYSDITANGDTFGLLPVIFEKEWQWLVKNKDKVISEMGEDTYNALVGEPKKNGDTPYLLDKLVDPDPSDEFEVNTPFDRGKGEYGAGYLDYVDKDGVERDCVDNYFFSSYNNGLYGQIINKMGHLKYHSNYNIKDHDTDITVINRVGSKENMDKFLAGQLAVNNLDAENFLMLDQDVVELMQQSETLYSVSRSLMSDETFNEMAFNFASSINGQGLIGKALKALNISVSEDNAGLLADFIMTLSSGLVKPTYDKETLIKKNMTLDDIQKLLVKDNFDITPITQIRDASEKIKHKNYWNDLNKDYRHEVNLALGVDDNGYKFVEDRIYSNLRKLVNSSEFQSLFGSITGYEAKNWLNEYFDGPILDDKTWVANNKSISSSKGIINKIEFDLEYTGLGNQNVTNFKVDNYNKIDPNEILTKLTTKKQGAMKTFHNDPEFANNYLGLGNLDELENVRHKYHVVWENKSDNPSKPNLLLEGITFSQAYVNDVWKDMLI